MSEGYIGEIRMFGGNFAPVNWALCNGQLISIAQVQALFSLIGTTYGGDGVHTFALPNLQGRLALGFGQGPGLSNYAIGQTGGSEEVALTVGTMPGHSHFLMATTTTADQTVPTGRLTGKLASGDLYTLPGSPAPTTGNLATQACGNTGGSLPHNNMKPDHGVTFIISLFGNFPSHN